jgi:hypothetical protein
MSECRKVDSDNGWTVCDECDSKITDDKMDWNHCLRPKDWWESLYGGNTGYDWPWMVCSSCLEDVIEQTDQTKEVKNVTE